MDVTRIKAQLKIIRSAEHVSSWEVKDFPEISTVNDKMNFIYNSFVDRSGERSYLLEETTCLWFDMSVLSQTLARSKILEGKPMHISHVFSRALVESLNDLMTTRNLRNAHLNISLSQLLVVQARLICSEILNSLLCRATSTHSEV